MKVSYQKELVTSARTTANAPGFKTQFKIVGITLPMPTHKILKSLQLDLFVPS